MAGFSFGIDKALICVTSGSLLGHQVGRSGASCSEDRTHAIWRFPPLKNEKNVREFLGCSNWVRWYLDPSYASGVKILGAYMKPDAKFPSEGLGPGNTPGDKAVRCIKIMCRRAIETSVMARLVFNLKVCTYLFYFCLSYLDLLFSN